MLGTEIHYSDEQAMLADSALAFCREHSPTQAVRRQLLSESGFDAELWSAMVALGWLGMAIPEALGGSGLTLAEAAVIAEPMGRHLLATPFASTQLATQGLLAGASQAQQTVWLPRICQGLVASVALFEADGDWDLTVLGCRAQRSADGWVLQGRKTLVADAGVAALLLVSVALDGAPAIALVATANLPPEALQRETVIDETRRSFDLKLDGLCLPAEAFIRGAPAIAALNAIRNGAWLLASAEAAGGIAGVLDVVLEYLNTRVAFGRKIGSYQALKHTCADILIGLERSRSHVAHAATLIASGRDAEVALRMAKAESGDSFCFAGDRAVQFHGGFGFTYDCDAQLYLRRALWLQAWFGDATHQRQRLADALWPLPQAGLATA